MIRIFARCFILLSSICITSACVAQNSDHSNSAHTITVEKVSAAQQCNMGDSASASWITNPTQFASTLKQMRSHILNAKISVPKINFQQYAVLLVSMGMQRSGGYGLEMSKTPLKIVAHTATLTLNWRKPAKGMITTQMLTSPCLLLKISKGNYKNLRVVTLTGKEIATLKHP